MNTAQGPIAMQVFMLRDENAQPIRSEDKRWAKVERDLAAVMDSCSRSELVAKLLGRRNESYFAKATITGRDDSEIKIFDGESSDYSVIEVHTGDAPELLHSITAVLSRHGLDIHRAMVSTEGDRVADVFYAQINSNKLSVAQGQALRADLLRVLE